MLRSAIPEREGRGETHDSNSLSRSGNSHRCCTALTRRAALRPLDTSEVDRLYPDRVLLAEANQWPADVVQYFGDPETGGNECHMAFHFPLMPRIFMAVRREQRYPISEIMAQTPAIPSGCQWGIFLRNHDELTLEMVTDDER